MNVFCIFLKYIEFFITPSFLQNHLSMLEIEFYLYLATGNIYAYPRKKSNNFLNNELKLLTILQNTLYQVFYRVLNTLLSYASYHISVFPGNQRGHLRSCQNTMRNVFWYYFSKNFRHELLTGPFIQLCIRLFFGLVSFFGTIGCICTKTA